MDDIHMFKLAVENVSDQIVITDPEGIVVYANPAISRVTGYKAEELIGTKAGKRWGGLMDKKVYEVMWHTIKADKKQYCGQFTNFRKNGKKYDADVRISPIVDEKGTVCYFVGIERDISQEKDFERSRNEFFSIAAHQLRTPLGTMRWAMEMLLAGDFGELADRVKTEVNRIYRNDLVLIKLVNDLLSVTRIDQKKVTDSPSDIRLTDVIQNILKEMNPEIKNRHLTLEFKASEQRIILHLDGTKLHEILENLISNAVKYNRVGGNIGITTELLSNAVKITVSDTGIGIPEKEREKTFDKFFRFPNAIEKGIEGTGLGLYITKTYLDQWGGRISFTSKMDSGTTFSIELPV